MTLTPKQEAIKQIKMIEKETSNFNLRTVKDMTEDELKEIEKLYGMPINRHPKPREIKENPHRQFFQKKTK